MKGKGIILNQKLEKLQKSTGYIFKNVRLLKNALTHSSYANEKHFAYAQNNERLEFLGDAVLELISSEFLYYEHPDMPEGEMTKLRASLVCERSLANSAREIDLSSYLYLGKGELVTGGKERDSILSDAFEAIIGAIYTDGGFTNAKDFVYRFVLNDIENKKLFYDSKSILQEMVQGAGQETVSYVVEREEGPDHDKSYYCSCRIGSQKYAIGQGKTKKAAQQHAAYETILQLRQENKNTCI